jgi:hypothetical protein
MLGIRNRVERSSRATRVLLREKARVASIFVRADGEAASDEETSEERIHLDLAADDVELKSAASRRSVPPGGITRQNAGAVGVGVGVGVRGPTSGHAGALPTKPHDLRECWLVGPVRSIIR